MIGAIFYVHTQDLQEQVNQEAVRTRFDPDHLNELLSDGESSATLSSVFLWSGAGLAVVSIVLFVVDGLDDGANESSVSLTPTLSSDHIGAAIEFAF